MENNSSRRGFLKAAGISAGVTVVGACEAQAGSGSLSSSRTPHSVRDLTTLIDPVDGDSYHVSGYRPSSTKGGGEFVWCSQTSKSLHDGVAVIDPEKKFPDDFNAESDLADWFSPGVGRGVYVKVFSKTRSGYEAGIADTSSNGDHLMLVALLNSLSIHGGNLAVLPREISIVSSITIEIPHGISLDLNRSTVEFRISGGVRAFSLNSSCQIYNGVVSVNGTDPIKGGDCHAPISGGDQKTGVGISKVKAHDLTLTTNRPNGNGIVLFGECVDCEIFNINFPSSSTLGRGVSLEWGGDQSGTGHPHNCTIYNITCGVLSGHVNSFLIWLSSSFNISVRNVFAESAYGVLGVFTGDRSNDYAPLRYRDNVGRGITADNISCANVRRYGIRCYGKGVYSRNLLPQSVVITNPVLRSDGNTSGTIGIVCEFSDGVRVINPEITGMQVGIATGQGAKNLSVVGGRIAGNRASGVSIGSTGGGVSRCSLDGVHIAGNNTARSVGVGGSAAVFIHNCSDWTVKDCWFGDDNIMETQQYSVRIEATARGGLLKDNRTLGLAPGGAAYVNGYSSDYDLGTIGGGNTAAAGITVSGGAPIYFISGIGRKEFIISGASSPSSGTWSLGDKCYFSTPSAGGHVGAVCVVAGTPGVWKPFGPISP